MEQEERDQAQEVEFDLTSRRRWVPLRGMAGAPGAPAAGPPGLTAAESSGGRGGRSSQGSPPAGREVGLPQSSSRGRSTAPRPALEWLIVGGGIHGTYLSHYLTEVLEVDPGGVRVLDPYDRPLAAWLRNSENVGMEYLRSPAVHHLDLPSLSLKRYAVSSHGGARPPFVAPYGRPLLALFNAHAEETIRRYRLAEMRIQGRACGLRATGGGYEVDCQSREGSGTIACTKVVLAIGMDDRTCWPQWAVELKRAGARVHHVLDREFRRSGLAPWERVVVYGGGLSGAQLSSVLAERAPGTVTLLSGHEMGVHLFDSEPSWQGGSFMAAFAAERDPARRREIIKRARHRGSLTPEARAELERLEDSGALRVVRVDPSSIDVSLRGAAGFRIESGAGSFEGDLLLLATGYDTARPGGEWLDRAIERMGLPCAPCGFPIVGPSLEWRRGLYLTGPLAELELGPVARNISGAHRAAARLEYFRPSELGRVS